MEKTKQSILMKVSESTEIAHSKITIVGLGAVGMAGAFSLMVQGMVSEMVLIEAEAMSDKLKGEIMDLQHGLSFCRNIRIDGGSDYAKTKGSKICIVTAGLRQKEGQSRLELIQGNADLFKKIIPQLTKYSPNATLIIVSNPVDALTWLAWKISGFPWHRVIGTGTMLDSSRFRHFIGQKFNISPTSVHGYVIGEHGDSSVPVWSGVNIGGIRLIDSNSKIGSKDDPENWNNIHKDVVESAGNIIQLKGYTSWAIGLGISTLVSHLLKNTHAVLALSVNMKGLYDFKEDLFMSNPCVVGENGIHQVFKLKLTKDELEQLQKSGKSILDTMKNVKL